MAQQMYVFSEVLVDFADGMVVLVAGSLEEAHRMVEERFEISVQERDSHGWFSPQVFPMGEQVPSSIVSYVFGAS